MKTHLFKILALIGCLLSNIILYAHDFKVDGIYYKKLSSTEVVVSYRGNSYDSYYYEYKGSVVIPASITYNGTTYNVTSIGGYAFAECTGLTEVTIPNSVTWIGDGAFYDCIGLTAVYITDISAWCGIDFGYDNYYANPLSYAHNLYINNELVTSLVIPDDLTSIGNYAFSDCTGLTEVTIGNSVTSISKGAFCRCSGLTEVTIPNSVTSIGVAAFASCTGLTSIVVDKDNQTYDSRDNCNAIIETATNTLITGCKNSFIPNSVTSIGDYVFSGCTGLTEITIPNSVTSIGKRAFSHCTGLGSVTIGNSVTSIGDYAFSGCTGLTEVTIPNSVTSIDKYAFEDCTGLTTLNFNAENCTTMGSSSYPVFEGCTNLKTLNISESVKIIPDYAFYGCTGLTEIVIGNSVTSIGDWAFAYCTGLTEVTIPNSVTAIGYHVFSYCIVLSSIVVDKDNQAYDSRDNCNAIIKTATNTLITGCKNSFIPNSVTSIGNYAFEGCTGLTEVTIGNSVTSIYYSAFEGCTGLKTLICEAIVPPTIEYNTFDEVNADIYISYRSSDAYKATSWGNLNLNFITKIIDDICYVVTNIADREAGITGVADKAVSTVVVPDSILQDSILHDTFRVTSIEVEAFKDCIELDEIVVSNSVEYIGNSAFKGCTGLRSVTLGSGVNEIGENTFTDCDRIKTVNCYAEVPPTIYSNTFTVYVNDNANLHVVNGSKDAYADAKYWEYFMNITDDLTAGVEDITCDNVNAPIEYYDLNGWRVENPTRGIYIMKQGSTVKKVVLKN